jgi:thioesterase domain-containing protein/acyl carrier protein
VRLGELPAEVRVVNLAGEALRRTLVDQLYEQEPIERVVNLYGPSEDTTYSTWAVMRRGEPGPVVIGRPISNTCAYVVDAQGEVVPLGVAGELWLGGGGLARGYLRRAGLTAEKFVPDGLSGRSGARMYRTGDLARYLVDGNIEYLGRIDQQVKIRGFRIEPGEIEARLKQHAAVREVVVIAREETNGDKRLLAFVVADPETNLTDEALRHYLREKLPEYMIPSTFVLLDEIPLTSNGKINRQALSGLAKNGAEHETTFVAPRDALELRIGCLWEEVLNVRPIGITDNFFDRGGHSLLAVRMMAQLSRQIGRELPLALILQKQTIEELATFLRQEIEPQDNSPLIAIQPHGRKPPFFCVHPAGGSIICYSALSRHLGAEQPFFGIQTPGVDAANPPLTRIESMAARYIEELQTVQSDGPYMLGGWSLGGVIAFEMAQQLRRQGLEVSLLAIFDSYVGQSTEIDDYALLLQFISDISGLYELDQSLTEGIDSPSQTTGERLASLLQEVVRKGWAPPDLNLEQLCRLFEVFRTNIRAMLCYEPHRYPGRITLFRASEQITDNCIDPAMEWRNLAADGVEVHVVPGDHYTMLREPAVQVMAEWLKVCIELAATVNQPQMTQMNTDLFLSV